MAEEQQPVSQADIEAMKNELADIKNEMMKKELEEVKRERMKKELADIKAERESKPIVPKSEYNPNRNPLLIPAAIIAMLSFLAAGYLIGTIYNINVSSMADQLVASYTLPVSGTIVVVAASVVLMVVGACLMILVKK